MTARALRQLYRLGLGEGLRARLLRGGAGSIGVRAGQVLAGLLLAVLLARSLGPAGYGVYAFALACVTVLATPAQAGLAALAVRETAKAQVDEDWARMRGLWRWCMRLALGYALAAAAAAGGILLLFDDWFEGPRRATLIAGLALLPLLVLGNLRASALRGLGRVVVGQLPEGLLRPLLLGLLVLIGLAVAPPRAFTPVAAMGLHVAAAAAAFLVGTWLLLRARPEGLRATAGHRTESAYWRRAAVPMAAIGGLQLINNQADILMLGVLRDDAAVGIYRVIVQGGSLVVFGLQAVNQVVQPQFARLHREGDHHRLQRLVTVSARATLLFALPPVMAFLLFGEPLLRVVFGTAYGEGAAALAIIAVGQLVNAGMGSVGMLLGMTGHERDTLRGVAFAAVANIGLNLALIPPFGIEGAAIASATTLAAWNLLLWRAVHKRLGIESTALGAPATRPARDQLPIPTALVIPETPQALSGTPTRRHHDRHTPGLGVTPRDPGSRSARPG